MTTAADSRLAEIFNRVADDITATHGPARLRTDQPVSRIDDDPFMTAAWFLGGANNGFKIYDCGNDGARVITWAHVGDLASATVYLRSWDAVEAALRAVLPPALSAGTHDEASDVSRGVASDASYAPSPATADPCSVVGEGLNPTGPVSRTGEEAIGSVAPGEGRC